MFRVRRSSGILALAFGMLAFLLASACERGPRVVSRGGTTVRRVEHLEPSRMPDGVRASAGDFVLSNQHVRVVVGGLDRPPDERGAILEAQISGVPNADGVVLLAPSVHVGRRRFRVEVESLRARTRAGRALLRISGSVHPDPGPALHFTSEISLSPHDAGIGVWSKVVPEKGALDVRLGARISWGGAVPFAPGLGSLDKETWHDASYVGADHERFGTVYALLEGPIRIGAEYETHGTVRILRDTEVMGPVTHASRRAPAMQHAFLVLARPGLGEAVRHLGWLRGAPFREAFAHLAYAPRDALVRVETDSGADLVRVRPNTAGDAILPLPPVLDRVSAGHVAIGTAPGHASSDPVRFGAGDRIRVDIPRGGRVRIVAREARTGARIPARVRFLPVQRKALDLGPDWSARGAGDSVILRGEEAIVPLPPGTYRVLVTHGPEWSLHEQAIVVTETFRPDVEAKLERVIDPGEWIAADLHVHASPSPDSNVTLEDRVASLVAEGIGFAVPTDHNHVTDYAPAARELGLDESTFLTTCGIEATTTIPHFGHFNAYPVSPDEALATNGATIVEGLGPTELFARLRTLGPNVVVQVNHPRMEGGIGYFDCVGYDPSTGRASGPYSADYDLLEVWNGFDLARGPVLERVFGEWLAMVARGRHVTAVGNSDSHQIRYEWAGYPRTYVRTREHSPLSIVASLRAGHAFVTSGPFLEATVGAAGPGDVAPTTGGQATVRVRVRTPRFMSVDRVEIWMGAAKVRDERLTSSSPASAALRVYEASFAIPVEHDTGLVVLVRGDTTLDDYFGRAKIPPVAFTNPIWIDADGDEHGPTDPGDPRVEEHRNVEARRAR